MGGPALLLPRARNATGSFASSYAHCYNAVGNRLTQDANGTRTTYGYDDAPQRHAYKDAPAPTMPHPGYPSSLLE